MNVKVDLYRRGNSSASKHTDRSSVLHGVVDVW